MIVYNVTINIDANIEKEWLHWMKTVHVPEVLATGLFLENKILRIHDQEKMEGTSTYAFQYVLKSMADYETYRDVHAPALQKSHIDKFNGRFAAFRTLMDVVE